MATPQTEGKIYMGIGLDFETGSLDCINGACAQLAMQAIRLDTMETTGSFMEYIYPYQKQDIAGPPKRKALKSRHEPGQVQMMAYQPEALNYAGITMDMLYSMGVDFKKVARAVIDFVTKNTLSKGHQAKPVLIGQNITFDIGFLQQLINYSGLLKEFEKVFSGTKDFYGNFQPHYIDSLFLARLALGGDNTMNSYKLEMISEKLGIELDDAHDALADVTACLNVVRVCSARMRNSDNSQALIQKNEKTRNHFKI